MIVFVLVVVPALGSAYDGFRNVVIIVFANLQIVAIIGQVPESPSLQGCLKAHVSSTHINVAK